MSNSKMRLALDTRPIKVLCSRVPVTKSPSGRLVAWRGFLTALSVLLFICPSRAWSQQTNLAGDSAFTLVFQHHQGFLYEGQKEWRELIILTNGMAWGRQVTCPAEGQSGFQEKRYQIQLTPDDLQRLKSELHKHQFMTMTNTSRTNVTRVLKDEAGYSISLRFTSGRRHDFYWAEGDPAIPHFYPLGDYLYSVYWPAVKNPPVYSGKLDPAWRPKNAGR